MDYVLVGTDHILQCADSKVAGLKPILESIVATHPVVLIAEEIKTSENIRTFGRELIGESKWLSIDMTEEERKATGIYEVLRGGIGPVRHPLSGNDVQANPYHRKSEGVRENFWLDKIEHWCKCKQLSTGTVVITCGHNHLDFLAEKVEKRGNSVSKLEYLPYDKEAAHGLFTIFED